MTDFDPDLYLVPVLAGSVVWLWSRPLGGGVRAGHMVSARRSPELIGAPALAAAGWLLGSPVILALGLIAYVAVRVGLNRRRRRNLAGELDEALITLIDDLSQQLRSGAVLGSSFCSLVAADGRLSASFGEAATAVGVGAGLQSELQRVAERSPADGVRLVAIALSVLVRSGGPSVPALERLAQSLRDRRASLDERRLQSSQARASAAVLGLLPVVFAVVAAALDPDVRHFYLRTLAGASCLLLMVGLVGACWLWIDILTEERPWPG